jgi:dienelactone hydrolase
VGPIIAVMVLLISLTSACAGQRAAPATRPPASTSSAGSAASTPVATPTRASVTGRMGTYRVRERQVQFTEPSRSGPASNSAGSRPLVTQIWYPQSDAATEPFPLLIFAPGFLQCSGSYADLLEAWASAGYVVAAVTFPHTSCSLGTKANETDIVNQPEDMSYVLTRLLTLNAQPNDPFSDILNPREIGAVGQSDGGDTVAALAANSCCIDNRIRAVAVLSGAEWPAMPGRYFAVDAPPMLFTQGSADEINPPWMSLQLYRADLGSRYYLDLVGAGHLFPYQGDNSVERLVARVTSAFFDRYILGQTNALEMMKRDGNSAGKAALVSGGKLPP